MSEAGQLMTDDSPERARVTEADRKMYAAYLRLRDGEAAEPIAELVLTGRYDGNAGPQIVAFARHRLTAEHSRTVAGEGEVERVLSAAREVVRTYRDADEYGPLEDAINDLEGALGCEDSFHRRSMAVEDEEIKRVAQAIAHATSLQSDSGVYPKWSDFRDEARAAIAALSQDPRP